MKKRNPGDVVYVGSARQPAVVLPPLNAPGDRPGAVDVELLADGPGGEVGTLFAARKGSLWRVHLLDCHDEPVGAVA